jgi:hypothetical protein
VFQWAPVVTNKSIEVFKHVAQGFKESAEAVAVMASNDCSALNLLPDLENSRILNQINNRARVAVDLATELNQSIDDAKKKLGLQQYPLVSPLLTGDGNETIPDMATHFRYIVQNLDAVAGEWPLKATYLDADGTERKLVLQDVSHAISEIFAALKIVGEDADSSTAILLKLAVELAQTRIATLQGNDLAKASADFFGYRGSAEPRAMQSQFTMITSDKKIPQADQVRAMLSPSELKFVGWKYQGQSDLLGMATRILSNTEIGRAVHARTYSSGLTGDHIKNSRFAQQARQTSEWLRYQEMLKKSGATIKIQRGARKKNDGKP